MSTGRLCSKCQPVVDGRGRDVRLPCKRAPMGGSPILCSTYVVPILQGKLHPHGRNLELNQRTTKLTDVATNKMDLPYICNPCGKICNSNKQYIEHLESEKHMRKMNLLPSNPVVDSPNHPFRRSGEIEMNRYIKKLGNQYYCKACDVYMNNILTAESHARGQKHLKTISNIRLGNPLCTDIALDIETTLTAPNSEFTSIFDGKFPMPKLSIDEVIENIKVINVNDPIIF